MPYVLSRWLIQRVNSCDEEAAIFYFHPWEIDPGQPRVIGVDAKTRFRHYVNLERTAKRLRLLLRDFRWVHSSPGKNSPMRFHPGSMEQLLEAVLWRAASHWSFWRSWRKKSCSTM